MQARFSLHWGAKMNNIDNFGHVSRSRLFREAFLPGAFPALRNGSVGRVVGVRNSSTALDGIDKEQLREAVENFVQDWEKAGGQVDPALRDDKGRLEMQSPIEIFVSASPTMLVCDNCKTLQHHEGFATDDDAARKIKGSIQSRNGRTVVPCKRPGCSGQMRQLPLVAVHRCGAQSKLYVSPRTRPVQYVGFRDGGSIMTSSYFDVQTGAQIDRAFQDKCGLCAGKYQTGVMKRGTPLTSGESFYAQGTQYIALGEERGRLIARLLGTVAAAGPILHGQAMDIAEGVALGLIGGVSYLELEGRLQLLMQGGPGNSEELAEMKQQRERLKTQLTRLQTMDDDGVMDDVIRATQEKIASIDAKLANTSGGFSQVRDLISDSVVLQELASRRRSMEALFLSQDVNGLELIEAAKNANDPIVGEAMLSGLSRIKDHYGIASITHIPDLRVVLATVGFTREKSSPSEPEAGTPPVVLNAFVETSDPSMKGKTPIYAMGARTEAIWVKLDPRRVLAWCVEAAGWERPSEEVLMDRTKAHAYLLQNSTALGLNPGQVIQRTHNQDPKYSAPFHLLHSISHALMLTARRHTGYDAKNLQEYLLPMDLSLIIYVSSVQNYTAGGLLTLFHHYLEQWFDDASMFAFNCAFDPVCTDSGGSCSGCIQIELACETFNRGLSRAFIHGGATDRDSTLLIKKGFWDATA